MLAAGFLNPETLSGVVRSDRMYASEIEKDLLATVGLDLLCVSNGDSPVLA